MEDVSDESIFNHIGPRALQASASPTNRSNFSDPLTPDQKLLELWSSAVSFW
jgi:hypothetical protein